MDFEDTPQEAAFRADVRAWIDANAPKHLEAELRRANFGSSGVVSEDPILAGKAWQKKKFDAGWACLHWPKEYGGGARTPIGHISRSLSALLEKRAGGGLAYTLGLTLGLSEGSPQYGLSAGLGGKF